MVKISRTNQLEKLEAARSAYIMLLLVIFPYLWLPFLAFRFTEPYWATGPYCAWLGLTGPYWALLGLTGPYWALLGLTGPYFALLGLTGPYFALLGLTGPY